MRGEALYCRSIALDGPFPFVKKKGGQPLKWAAEVGLKPSFNSKSIDFVRWNALCEYLELCAKRLNMPAFGIEWAHDLPDDPRNSGPTLLVAAISKNLRQSLKVAVEYQKIHTNGVTYSIQENEAAAEVTGYVDIHPMSNSSRQYCEHILAFLAIYGERYIPRVDFTRVTFQHKAPANTYWHEKTFKHSIIFNADRNSLVSNISVLNTPSSHLTTLLLPLLRTYLNRRQRSVSSRTSVAMDVAETLPQMFGLKRTRITDMAEALEISEKKLQRLLRDEGVSYSAVLDDVRRNSATRLLQESNISITRLAKMLDYSTVESFNFACKRWHGQSPRQVRQMRDR